MPLLLHLSDLHLADPDVDPDVGDYKSELVPAVQRQKRITLITNMLRALPAYLESRAARLDAVVITGDITVRGNAAGLAQLPELLANLGSACPQPERIVVVPGNHDVVARTDPGSNERYAPFVAQIRSRGYVTPLLDGVDYDAAGQPRVGVPAPILNGDGYLVAAINSADYSASRAPLSATGEEALDALIKSGTITRDLAQELERLRFNDVARINGQQLRALRRVLDEADSAGSKVSIAAMHHQLAPVSADEEFKAFETFTNLGELRMFLADNGFRIVLHGHKHRPRVVEDIFVPYDAQADNPLLAFRSVVVSCGTIDASPGVGGDIAKLIDLDTSAPNLVRVRVTALRAPVAGGSLKTKAADESRHMLARESLPDETTVLHGSTLDGTYDLVLDLCDRGIPSHPVVCVVDDGPSAGHRPSRYPDGDARNTLDDQWFQQTVDWWENPTSSDVKPFTHGQFVRHWRGSLDQVKAAVESLAADPTTSRAVITLLDPPDDEAHKDHRFPAFCLVHFLVIGSRLCAVALFRKQELRYWWPINVAEIAKLQREIVHGLRSHGKDDVVGGSITTIADMAVASPSLPQVGVPRIDQLAWSNPLGLWRHALAVADPGMPGRHDEIAALRGMLAELLPTPITERPADGAPLSTRGVRALNDALESLSERYALTPEAARGVELLSQLADRTEAFAASKGSSQAYTAWQRSTTKLVNELLEVLTRV